MGRISKHAASLHDFLPSPPFLFLPPLPLFLLGTCTIHSRLETISSLPLQASVPLQPFPCSNPISLHSSPLAREELPFTKFLRIEYRLSKSTQQHFVTPTRDCLRQWTPFQNSFFTNFLSRFNSKDIQQPLSSLLRMKFSLSPVLLPRSFTFPTSHNSLVDTPLSIFSYFPTRDSSIREFFSNSFCR